MPKSSAPAFVVVCIVFVVGCGRRGQAAPAGSPADRIEFATTSLNQARARAHAKVCGTLRYKIADAEWQQQDAYYRHVKATGDKRASSRAWSRANSAKVELGKFEDGAVKSDPEVIAAERELAAARAAANNPAIAPVQ